MLQKKVLTALVVCMLLVVSSSFSFPLAVFAASCGGTGCNGTFASATGCDASITNARTIYPASARLDLRKSLTCNTVWTKTTNTDSLGRAFYANATLWYQQSGTNNYYSISSGGSIAKGQSVVSQQRYYPIPSYTTMACGKVSSGYITPPVGTPCTSTY